jgi:hypothetical protein
MSVSKFQTLVEVPKYRWQTGYFQKCIFMGSCFTENIGNRMETLKYDVDVNPFGILYNPFSVSRGLRILIQQKEFKAEDLIFSNGLWHSFSHHGRFSSTDKNEALEQINSRIIKSARFLKNAGFLFITFGTAWIYKFKKTGQPVSNCHKIPAKEFERVRLTVDEIVNEYRDLLTEIRKVNSSLKVVFTVSPIRHWKDGAIENQRSKAVLLLAIDKLIKEFGDDFCAYFPAYEIVMDELRDYRFYAEDMIHISDVAVEHIWEKFQSALIDKESQQIAARVQKIVKAASHKPIHKNTPEYNQFVLQITNQIEELESKYKHLNFAAEKTYLKTETDKTGQIIG